MFTIGVLLAVTGLFILGRNHQIALFLGVATDHPSDRRLSTSVARQNVVVIGALFLIAGVAIATLF